MFKRYILIFLYFGLVSGCQSVTQQNPLVGSWERDIKRTLADLTLQDAKYQNDYVLINQLMRCEEDGGCARTVLEYTEHESITSLFDDKGNRVGRRSIPYRLIAINDGYKVVTESEPEGTPVVREGNLLRFEFNYKGFTWWEYWRPQGSTVR